MRFITVHPESLGICTIERHFRTINQQLLHQLPGTTFSNTVVKGDYDSKKHASIRFNVFLEIFHKWLLDEYINEFHKGVKGVPSKLWKRAFESRPRPAVPSEQLEWKIALMKLGYGSIQKRVFSVHTLCINRQS